MAVVPWGWGCRPAAGFASLTPRPEARAFSTGLLGGRAAGHARPCRRVDAERGRPRAEWPLATSPAGLFEGGTWGTQALYSARAPRQCRRCGGGCALRSQSSGVTAEGAAGVRKSGATWPLQEVPGPFLSLPRRSTDRRPWGPLAGPRQQPGLWTIRRVKGYWVHATGVCGEGSHGAPVSEVVADIPEPSCPPFPLPQSRRPHSCPVLQRLTSEGWPGAGGRGGAVPGGDGTVRCCWATPPGLRAQNRCPARAWRAESIPRGADAPSPPAAS